MNGKFYREISLNWSKFLSYEPSVPSTIPSQYLGFNKHTKIGNNGVYFSDFSNHGICFIGNLVVTSWRTIKFEYNLTDKKNLMAPTSLSNTKIMGRSIKEGLRTFCQSCNLRS